MTIDIHQIYIFLKHLIVARKKGHNIHSPFAYQLCEEVFYNTNSFYDFDQLNKTRADLLKNESNVIVTDLGAGSRTLKSNERKIKEIAEKGISTKRQSEVLFKLINLLRPKNIIELGTSIGLNTLYLANANKNAKIYTIEGSENLSDFAKQLAQSKNVNNCEYITGNFDSELPKILDSLETVDFVYIDGNHTYDATIKYFNEIKPKINNNSVIIFDDIYWSRGMTKAWNEIKQDKTVTLSIDTFYFGLIFFKKEIKEKIDLRIVL